MKFFGKKKKIKPVTLNFLFEKYKPVFNEVVNINFHKIFPIKSNESILVENLSISDFGYFKDDVKANFNDVIGILISVHLEGSNYLLVFRVPYEPLYDYFGFIFEKEISHSEYDKVMEILNPYMRMTFDNGKLISAIDYKGNSTEEVYDYSNFK